MFKSILTYVQLLLNIEAKVTIEETSGGTPVVRDYSSASVEGRRYLALINVVSGWDDGDLFHAISRYHAWLSKHAYLFEAAKILWRMKADETSSEAPKALVYIQAWRDLVEAKNWKMFLWRVFHPLLLERVKDLQAQLINDFPSD